jgi:long-chain-fatty-acid--CoA ligase ACSBG
MNWCRSVGSDAETIDDIIKMRDDLVFHAIQKAIDAINVHSVSNAARVQKWTILPRDLSVAGGELGPTLKLKRFFINEKYKRAIDKLYDV